ncbi:MAG: MFS transporter [Acidobacteria bacterium]|nr:MFS transporter [Acidobacteriota bacterium]
MASAAAVSIPAYYRLLRGNRNMRLLWWAQVISEIGDWLYTVSLYSLIYELTGSAKAIGLVLVFQVLPQFFIGPTGGAINDHVSRRKVLIFADIVRAVVIAAMLLVRTVEALPWLFALLFLETAMWAFFEPGRAAIIPNITRPGPESVTANSLSSMTWSVNFFLGSGLGGLLGVGLGRDAVFLIDAVSFLVSAWLIQRMKFNEPHLEGKAPLTARDLVDFRPIADGARYIWNHPRLATMLIPKFGLGLLGANWVILPVLGQREFKLGTGSVGAVEAGMLGMSVLMSARGLGAMIGPLAAGGWVGSNEDRMRRAISVGFLLILAGYGLLAVAPNVWVACAVVALAHAGGSTIWVFSTTLLQAHAEDRFRGRVFAADFGFLVLAMSMATYAGGLAIDGGVPVRTVALATGLIVLGPCFLWTRLTAGWKRPDPDAMLKVQHEETAGPEPR